jgi:diguanylate cyclase (GGDEF)-like protein
LGHQQGDLLIKSIAKVLKETFRSEDIAARIGGDEFAVLLPQMDSVYCHKILDRLKINTDRQNRKKNVREVDVAIGTATCEPGENLSLVLKHADERMYINKKIMKDSHKKNHPSIEK